MRAPPLAVLVSVMASAAGISASAHAEDHSKPTTPRCEDFTSIGTAIMDEQGVITMNVHTLPPDSPGTARLVYRPDDPNYQDALKHLGPIKAGETVNVPPWC